MVIRIKKPLSKENINTSIAKQVKPKPSLREFFGTLKRGINPLEYQKEQRSERD